MPSRDERIAAANAQLDAALRVAHEVGIKLYQVRDLAHAIWRIPIDQCDEPTDKGGDT